MSKDNLLKGDITENEVILNLWKKGYEVLKPTRPSSRYDLALDSDGKLIRLQCKTGKYANGVVTFSTRSVDNVTQKSKSYKGDIDLFAVYCPQLDQVYYVPVDEIGNTQCLLRIDKPKVMMKTMKWGKDYHEIPLKDK